MKKILQDLPSVLIGNAILSLTVVLFLIPSGLVTGGATGIAMIMNHSFGFSVSRFVFIFNLLMMILGLLLMGKAFAATAVVSSLAYPAFLALFEKLLSGVTLTDDILLNTVFTGLGMGAALGIVLRTGASTGGMDIPPLILNKYLKFPIALSMYVFDVVTLAVQVIYVPVDMILYGIVSICIYTLVIDKIVLAGTSKTQLVAISKRSQDIRNVIISELDRGVTLLHATSGYTESETNVILSVISNRELVKVERLIRDIDPECFLIVTRVSEVRGRGFSQEKKYMPVKGQTEV